MKKEPRSLFTQDNIKSFKKDGVEVSIFPNRGGIITSLKIDGTELLYQDMYSETLFDESKSVKGGIPFMFPNLGVVTDGENESAKLDLPQHGIGRINPWILKSSKLKNTIIQEFNFEETKCYPYKGKVTQSINIENNGVSLVQDIYNTGTEKMPISTGLHPYFRVPEGDKSCIEWNFEGGEKIATQIDIWGSNGTIVFDNPGKDLNISIPGLGELKIETSPEYKKIWIRSLPGKDFVCIEPVMGYKGAIVNDPIIVKPGEVNSNYMKIFLEQ